ncbi:Low affinity potassium transport system protein kup [Burkholderia cepacia]|nr:Low affinity potassium transport system protein kup [Burkholderia cepacia]
MHGVAHVVPWQQSRAAFQGGASRIALVLSDPDPIITLHMNDTIHATDAAHAPHSTQQHSMRALAIAAIGVVFGDIGTSPLYSLKERSAPHTAFRSPKDRSSA